jgi:hypothetical protein
MGDRIVHDWTPAPDDWPQKKNVDTALAKLADWDKYWPDPNACDPVPGLTPHEAKALIAELRRLRAD